MSQPALSPHRHARGLSFRSDRSSGSKNREDVVESPQEKLRRDQLWNQGSKANPNAALQEAQPGDYALLEQATIGSLRNVQHKDTYGNLITDPDLSNPTRPRFERPLDTIRSFERAIDNGYKRRSSYGRSVSYDPSSQSNAGSRRGSYYGNDTPGPSRPVTYGYAPRPDSQVAGSPHQAPRTRYGRMQSDSQISSPRPYVQHGHHASHDTMHTGMTSHTDSTGPWANSTDPSSDNSSFDRVAADYSPGYGPGPGPNGFAGGIPEEGGAYPQGGRGPPIQPPPHARRPIPLGGDGGSGQTAYPPAAKLPTVARPEPEKRKSWLKRRFSRKNSD